jgi:alpha-L-fucosidase
VALLALVISQGFASFSLHGCSSSVNALASRDAGPDAPVFLDGAQGADRGAETGTQACPAQPGGPTAIEPVPSAVQAVYQRAELTAYIHLGLETFDGTEQGDAAKDVPGLFNPSNLDASQWVSALKAAGFRQATLTAKHGTGFCLWPSANTDFSVKGSPWKNGQGDVVREFTDAMHAADMRVGLYVSPLDQHYPSSSPTYEAYFRNLLTELLTNYGTVAQLHFDGYNAPRTLDWTGIVQLAKQLQPNILVWMGPEIAAAGADVRWNGSLTGQSSRSTASVGDVPNGGPKNVWYPAETPVSVHVSDWFWHPNATTVSLKSLQTTIVGTVGANTTLGLSVPPSTAGLLDAADVNLLQDFGAWYASLYKTNLLAGQATTADATSTWAAPGFEVARALDGNVCTYWAAASGRTSGRIEVTPASPITFSLISIREPIELGERVTGYHVELKQNGTWNRAVLDASGTQVQGTVIGQRQLWQLDATTADGVALVIDAARDVPAIAEFGVY